MKVNSVHIDVTDRILTAHQRQYQIFDCGWRPYPKYIVPGRVVVRRGGRRPNQVNLPSRRIMSTTVLDPPSRVRAFLRVNRKIVTSKTSSPLQAEASPTVKISTLVPMKENEPDDLWP